MTDLSNHIGEADEKVTADHAERLERAEKWVAEMGKWKTLNPTTAEAYIYGSFLLSEIAALRREYMCASERATDEADRSLLYLKEIAALRGERDAERDENTRWLIRMADIREASGIGVKPMLTEVPAALKAMREHLAQAERQNDELRKALEFYAQPIWSIRGEFPEASPHSEYRPDCGDTARQALANQGAE